MDKFAVIGPGRVGTALTLALQNAGYSVLAAHGSSQTRTGNHQRFESLTGVPVLNWETFTDRLQQADVVVVSVPDKAVTSVAQTLGNTGDLCAGKIVVHTAGALGSDALAAVQAAGSFVLGLHPLQTVADPAAGVALLRGAYCTLEGDSAAVAQANQWIADWGGIAVTIEAKDRPRYHAAAVLASNAVVALAAVAVRLSGLEAGVEAFLPLLQGAVQNLRNLGVPDALTGPVDRGDFRTVESHLQALKNNPTELSVYAALGIATADVAFAKGSLSPLQRDQFVELFRNHSGGYV